MKKIFLSVAVIGLATAIISCQSNQNETSETQADSSVIATKDTSSQAISSGKDIPLSEITATTKIEAPQFSSEEVNENLAEFEALKQEYITAVKSKDAAKIKAVTAKYNAWVPIAANWGGKLPQSENQAYINYYTKLVTQWDQITPKK